MKVNYTLFIAPHELQTFTLNRKMILQELQACVGGYIERVPMPETFTGDLYAHEEGLLVDAPVFNVLASLLMRRTWIKDVLDSSPDDPFTVLEPGMMTLVGDLVLEQIVEWNDDV